MNSDKSLLLKFLHAEDLQFYLDGVFDYRVREGEHSGGRCTSRLALYVISTSSYIQASSRHCLV